MPENSQETPTPWLLRMGRIPFPWLQEESPTSLLAVSRGHAQPPEAARIPCHTAPHL